MNPLNWIRQIRLEVKAARAVVDMACAVQKHYGGTYQDYFAALSPATVRMYRSEPLRWMDLMIGDHYELHHIRLAQRRGVAA